MRNKNPRFCYENNLNIHLQTIGLWDSLTPSFFTVIDLVMAILLGIRCEVFIREVKETKRLVITVMSIHYDGNYRAHILKVNSVGLRIISPQRMKGLG